MTVTCLTETASKVSNSKVLTVEMLSMIIGICWVPASRPELYKAPKLGDNSSSACLQLRLLGACKGVCSACNYSQL